jgi:hypothetical protein
LNGFEIIHKPSAERGSLKIRTSINLLAVIH